MNNHNLREILMKIQDRLSENDRKKLCFLLPQDEASLDGSISPIHSEHTNEQNINYLIEVFEAIQCDEAVKLLKGNFFFSIYIFIVLLHLEHINQTQSTMPPATIEDNEKFNLILVDKKNDCDNNNMLINSNNTNINPITVVLSNQSKHPLRSKRRHLLNILSIILAGLVIIDFIQITRLKINYENILNEQIKNKEIIEHLKNLLSNVNETIQQLTKRIDIYDQEQRMNNILIQIDDLLK